MNQESASIFDPSQTPEDSNSNLASPSSPTPAPAVELIDLQRSFGSTQALRGVDLRVPAGEIFGYLGPNGAGKTTTLKILAGLIRPTQGEARVKGYHVVDDALEAKSRLGYVPESGAVFLKLTAREYLRFLGEIYGLERETIETRMSEKFDFFELRGQEDRPLGSLSKGNRQKVCWTAALLHEPEVLVLDEPLNGLDVAAVALVKDLLRESARQGRTIFYSSHLVDVVEKLCTRIGVIREGRVVAAGTQEEILAQTETDHLEEAMARL